MKFKHHEHNLIKNNQIISKENGVKAHLNTKMQITSGINTTSISYYATVVKEVAIHSTLTY